MLDMILHTSQSQYKHKHAPYAQTRLAFTSISGVTLMLYGFVCRRKRNKDENEHILQSVGLSHSRDKNRSFQKNKKCFIHFFFLFSNRIVYCGCYKYFRFSEKKTKRRDGLFPFQKPYVLQNCQTVNEHFICYQQSILHN